MKEFKVKTYHFITDSGMYNFVLNTVVLKSPTRLSQSRLIITTKSSLKIFLKNSVIYLKEADLYVRIKKILQHSLLEDNVRLFEYLVEPISCKLDVLDNTDLVVLVK